MNVLKKPNEALKASLSRLKALKDQPAAGALQRKHSLVFQRLFWGALAGCLVAVFFGDSALLENLELSMLDWRYKTADSLARKPAAARLSKDIAIVAFDDTSQFDLGCPRFNDSSAQSTLAEILDTVEKGDPSIVAVDLDLRGAANPNLVRVFRRYRNVILAVFGSLEGSSDLPDASFLKHAIGYGYDELTHEDNGMVLRLPVNAPNQMGTETSGLTQVPSLTEAVVGVYRQMKGLGPNDQLLSITADQPIYINFKRVDYPVYSMSAIRDGTVNSSVFNNRIVIVAPTLTSKRQDPSKVVTPLRGRTPEVFAHADAVNTILANEMIFSYPKAIAHHILILLGAFFAAVCAVLPAGRRAVFTILGAGALVVVAQIAFETVHVALPVVAPLAMLLAGLIIGTVIHLDTDLRQRNRELATAREHMQVRAEEERKRIAGDLHDETLPALSAVARMIDELHRDEEKARPSNSMVAAGEAAERASEGIRNAPPEGSPLSVPERMRRKLDQTISEMRRVINDLHPSVLETMGFVPALENLAVILSRDANIEYTFIDRNEQSDYDISDFTRLQLYRIVQEALNNVGKHAQASKVELKVQTHHGRLEISVADNGKGIDPRLIRRDSHGLLNIRHRAQLIGATVEWRRPQAFAQGTEIRVAVPLAADTKTNGSSGDNHSPGSQTQKGMEQA